MFMCKIPAGVQVRPHDYADFSSVKRVVISCTDQQYVNFLAFAQKQISKPYDKTAILGFAFDRDWREPDSWFCSELASAAFEAAGILKYHLATTVNRITPEDLLLVCSVLTEVSQ